MSEISCNAPPVKTTICFVAGHSGGHILPCITKAKQLQRDHHILFFSTSSDRDQKMIQASAVATHFRSLSVESVPYRNKLRLPLFFVKLLGAFFTSFYYLIANRPQKIITTGGYVAIPVCLAGWLLRIPIELYELNVEPGKAVSFLSPLAHTIWIMYEQTTAYLPAHKCKLADYPIRFDEQAKQITKEQALKSLNFSTKRTTLFVIGGSQGSQFLNKLITDWVMTHPELHESIQIIHQTGAAQSNTAAITLYASRNIPAYTFAYDERLALLYQATDIVITRAGAGTLAELLFFQKKSIIIPLETHTTNHQQANALAMQAKAPELFTVLSQKEVEQDQTRFSWTFNSIMKWRNKWI